MRVELRVNTEALGSEAEPLARKIDELGANIMAERGVIEARDPLDPAIIVAVERIGTEENPGYVVGFSVEKGDEIVSGSARQADCSLCTRGELLERIEAELPALMDLAAEYQVPAPVGDEGGGDEGGEDEGGGDEDGGDERVKPIGPLGFGGIGVAVLGAAGVGVGAAFTARGTVPIEPNLEQQTDYGTPGIVVLSVGAVALIGGVVMIAVDVSKRKKARQRQTSAKARVELRGLGFAF